MAQTHRLQLIVDAENRAKGAMTSVNKSLDSVHGKLERLQPAFRKMAVAGVAAFSALALGAKSAIDQAAKAEGSYNKFNAVFGEHRDDMLEFVKEIRKEMPTATSEIVRMAADMQDLLVPMGMARDEATEVSKGFLDLANKVAAFNDVDPTEVLEAIKSGLAGSSEPLRRYGINALETALEARAMKEGLLEAGQTFKDLDPEVKNSVRAQALLAQAIENSSDAIEGFEANADSFIRRKQEMAARTIEVKEAIGNLLLPIFDEYLKKLLPIIAKVQEWIEANPELVLKIGKMALAVAGAVTALGAIGIILPAVVTGLSLLTGPIGLVMIAAGILAVAIKNLKLEWGNLIQSIDEKTGIITALKDLWEDLKDLWTGVVVPALKDLFEALKPLAPYGEMMAKVFGVMLLLAFHGVIQAIRIMASLLAGLLVAATKLTSFITKVVIATWNEFGEVLDFVISKIEAVIRAIGKLNLVKQAKGFIGGAVEKVASFVGRQHGGPVTAGESYMVGERGPELFTPGQYGRISAGGGANITINITDNEFVGEEGVAERIGSRIMRSIKDTVKL